jgi:adenylate cyclase
MQSEASYHLGEFAQAREHAEQGLAFYDPQQWRSHTFLYGNDTGIGCLIICALALWHLGYPDQALAMSREALDQAQALGHPFTLVFALHFKGLLHQLRREAPLAREHADSVLRISVERGFAMYLAWGTMLRGWALAQGHPERGPDAVVKGRVKEEIGQMRSGIDQMHAGIAAWRATGAAVTLPGSLASLAQACGQAGKVGEAGSLLDEALYLVNENGERCWEAELYRLKGELLLLRGEKEAQAEACFQRAIDVARRQRARSWELRAATSLARLWQGQHRKEEACVLLQGVYDCFSEGFDTVDLEDAGALLDALA